MMQHAMTLTARNVMNIDIYFFGGALYINELTQHIFLGVLYSFMVSSREWCRYESLQFMYSRFPQNPIIFYTTPL